MQEDQKEQKVPSEGKESDVLPEIEKSQTLFIQEESLNAAGLRNREKDKPGDTPAYCIICNKQIEKYGSRKEDLKKPAWVFCPKHGWIQEGVYNEERVSENPIRLPIEEVREDYNERENSLKQEESKILPETDTSKEQLMQEEVQQEAEFVNKREQQMTDLPTNVARNRLTFIIVPLVIFFIIIVSSLLGHFVWKGSSKEMLETKSLQALIHNKKLTIIQAQSKVSDPSQGSISPEKSTYEITERTSSHNNVDISASGRTDSGEKFIEKTVQTQKPLIAIYTVQVGAFTHIVYARSLQNRLGKKGYHCFISSQNSNKEGRLHKVWIGKFSNRKKAVYLSEKITKAESIRTFVTLCSNNI